MMLKESSILDQVFKDQQEFVFIEEVELNDEIKVLLELKTRAQITLQEFHAMHLYDTGQPLRFSDTQQRVELSGASKEQLIKVLIKALQEEITVYDTQINDWLNKDEGF